MGSAGMKNKGMIFLISVCVCNIVFCSVMAGRLYESFSMLDKIAVEAEKHKQRFYDEGYEAAKNELLVDNETEGYVIPDLSDTVFLDVNDANIFAFISSIEDKSFINPAPVSLCFEDYMTISYNGGRMVVWVDPNVPMNEAAKRFFAEVKKLVEP